MGFVGVGKSEIIKELVKVMVILIAYEIYLVYINVNLLDIWILVLCLIVVNFWFIFRCLGGICL